MFDENEDNQASIHASCAERPFGFEIQTAPDGRRRWPAALKAHALDLIDQGEKTVAEIAELCRVAPTVIYQWRKAEKQRRREHAAQPQEPAIDDEPVFVELTSEPVAAAASGARPVCIVFNAARLELPHDYPAAKIVEIMQGLTRPG